LNPVRGLIAALLVSARGHGRQIVNVGLLIAGLGLGQGAIFIVQTSLVAAGKYELLAAFGTHYSFAILAIILVDLGAGITLARAVAQWSSARGPRDAVWRMFCETSSIRLAVASLIGAVALVFVFGFSSDGFSRWYVPLALPGLLLWALNGVGLLDGLRLSGVSGMTGSAAYMVTAAGLFLARGEQAETAGAILGGAFSAGYLLTLAAQWTVLVRNGWVPQFRRLTRAGLAKAVRDGAALALQVVPAQSIMRVQIVLSAMYLGAETTALFVFAKQVLTAATQIIGFVLRVEFPGLAAKLSDKRNHSLGSIWGAQRMALFCAVTFAVGATIAAGVAALIPDVSLHRAAVTVAGFMPTILTMSLLLLMMQGLAAIGAYGASTVALAIGAAAGILASYLLISPLGVYAFAAGEVVLDVVGLYVGHRYLRRRK
jgi:hypothetical protein